MTKHTTEAEIHDTDRNAAGATSSYCPEDNKIRLYVGRVERETYNFLRQNKFTATPKQSCDFVATWSPNAEDIAFQLIPEDADIEDEDYSPEERAADRAERFAGYRDKRAGEAHGHADTYEDGPAAFGNQNAARAERQASRHERHRDRSLCQWSKAEYWQTRTASVIGHALHRSDASTRRGRILELEAAQRRYATPGSRYHAHLTMRLIYENAMLENEGGTAAAVEMIPGGWIGSRQIVKINRSPVTSRIVSVNFSVNGRSRNIERLGADVYRAPTPEELEVFNAALKADKQTIRAAAPVKPKLINPTPEAAQKLQDEFNRVAEANHARYQKYSSTFEPLDVCDITQDTYSKASKGTYAKAETRTLHTGGKLSRRESNMWTREGSEYDAALSPALCSIRIVPRFPSFQVIVLTDKPQQELPDWNTPEPTHAAAQELVSAPAGCLF